MKTLSYLPYNPQTKEQQTIYDKFLSSYSNQNNLSPLQKSIADSYSKSNAHQTLSKSFKIRFLEGKVLLSNK